MTHQDKIVVGEIWIALAAMYGKDLSQASLKLMLNAISDLDALKVIDALNEWAKTSKINRHPLPSDIRTALEQKANPKDLARLTALRIREAVSRFGWNNGSSAREYIGEAGWKTVNRFGGWLYICENLGVNLQETTFLAQARDTIESELNLEAMGYNMDSPVIEQNQKHSLPESREKLTNLIEGMTKKLDLKEIT